jgi:YesN/AraC family two-component response regulator
MQYLTAVRMQKAQTLLRSTNTPVTEISQACGYDNPVYFSEQFKKTVGTTPSIYRKISTMQQ